MVKNLKEYTVTIPRCAAADEFAIGCSQSVEDGVIEFLVVWQQN